MLMLIAIFTIHETQYGNVTKKTNSLIFVVVLQLESKSDRRKINLEFKQ